MQWSSDTDMRINTSKTKEMVICFCKDRTYVESLSYIDINWTDIERVTQAKVLGVTRRSPGLRSRQIVLVLSVGDVRR